MNALTDPSQVKSYMKKMSLPRSECDMSVIMRNRFEKLRLQDRIDDLEQQRKEMREEQIDRSLTMRNAFAEVYESSGYDGDGLPLANDNLDYEAMVEMKMYVKPWKLFHHVTEEDMVGGSMYHFNSSYGLKSLQRLNNFSRVPSRRAKSESSMHDKRRRNTIAAPGGTNELTHGRAKTAPPVDRVGQLRRTGVTPAATSVTHGTAGALTFKHPVGATRKKPRTPSALRYHDDVNNNAITNQYEMLQLKTIREETKARQEERIPAAVVKTKEPEVTFRRVVRPTTVSVTNLSEKNSKRNSTEKQRPKTVPPGVVRQLSLEPDDGAAGDTPTTKVKKGDKWLNLEFYVKPQERHKMDLFILKRRERLRKRLAIERGHAAEAEAKARLGVASSKSTRQRELKRLVEEHSDKLRNQMKPPAPKNYDDDVKQFLKKVDDLIEKTNQSVNPPENTELPV